MSWAQAWFLITKKKDDLFIFLINEYMCVCVQRTEKPLDPIEFEVEVFVSCLI